MANPQVSDGRERQAQSAGTEILSRVTPCVRAAQGRFRIDWTNVR
jgi:hypothetical protein